jgi:hypothetical protein
MKGNYQPFAESFRYLYVNITIMKILLFTFSLILALLISCKKKQTDVICDQTIEHFTNDTIMPSDYLMTYPGSWWKYNDGTKDSCTIWENVTYKEKVECKGCVTTNLDHHFLPKSTRFGLIDFESQANGSPATAFSKLIGGTAIGQLFYQESNPASVGSATYSTYKYYENHFNSLVIQNQTYTDVKLIRVEVFVTVSGNTNKAYPDQNYYFAKDVGLIKYAYYDQISGVGLDSGELVNHYIAPH